MEERPKLQLARTPEEIQALRDYWRYVWKPSKTTGFHYHQNEPDYNRDQGSHFNLRGWGR